jgi:hypothetical protein
MEAVQDHAQRHLDQAGPPQQQNDTERCRQEYGRGQQLDLAAQPGSWTACETSISSRMSVRPSKTRSTTTDAKARVLRTLRLRPSR